MKAPLIISLLALFLSGWSLVRSFQSDDKTEEAAERALREREKELVARVRPHFQRMFADMGTTESKEPETLEDLLTPLLHIMEMMEGGE